MILLDISTQYRMYKTIWHILKANHMQRISNESLFF